MIDPFSPEADPGREDEEAGRVGRRSVMTALVVLPAAVGAVSSLGGCTHPRPACPTVFAEPERCAHRFCRYHRG